MKMKFELLERYRDFQFLKQKLKENDGSVIAFIGAGVSKNIAGHLYSFIDWRGLLRHGLEYSVEHVPELDDRWKQRLEALLVDGCLASVLISVASQIEYYLKPKDRNQDINNSEFKKWIDSTLNRMQPVEDNDLVNAIVNLNIPIVTTNYDKLLYHGLERLFKGVAWEKVTWKDNKKIVDYLVGERPGIVHLHGQVDQVDSIILGFQSYEKILSDNLVQAWQKTIGKFATLLLIGVGDGDSDPNVGALLEWIKNRTEDKHKPRIFQLIGGGDFPKVETNYPFVKIHYGAYDHLSSFVWEIGPREEDKRPLWSMEEALDRSTKDSTGNRCYFKDSDQRIKEELLHLNSNLSNATKRWRVRKSNATAERKCVYEDRVPYVSG